jgi:hypothetical protein
LARQEGGAFCHSWCSSSITMVHIHSIAASSHPSRQERESDREATSCSRAGRPRRGGGRSTATARVDAAQCQHSASAAAVPLPVATAEAMMHTVRQLLNNPPPSGASPLVAEQLRHNIDQLVIAAINTPPLGGNCQPPVEHSCTPTPPQAPSVARAPLVTRAISGPWVPVTIIAMGDLHDELCLHELEDSRVTIEHR